MFYENRSSGFGAVWGGGRKSPSPIDLAHGLYNSWYTVQAVMRGVDVAVRMPPTIVTQPLRHKICRIGDSVILRCEATGEPAPT